MLQLEGVTLVQGQFRLSADLSLEPGGVTAVIGPSGGGKSTFLAVLAGFARPDTGRILWNAQDLGGLAPGKRPVTVVFQDHNLFPHLSLFQNVALGLRPSLRLREDEVLRVRKALERVGLHGMEARHPGSLSGGQRSRVALARVLVMERPLVLLDEPFAALGPGLRAEMGALVAELARAQALTVLMVTHAPEDARAMAERVIFVDEGKVFPPQPTAALFADPPEAVRRYLGRPRAAQNG